MTKRNKRHQNKNKPIQSNRLIQDNAAWGNGYMPRYGIDVPAQGGGIFEYMQPIEADEIYLHNTLAKNIVDIPAGDLTRNGWTLQMDNNKLAEEIMKRMRQLGDKKIMKKLFEYKRRYGIGAVIIGTDETNKTSQEPINLQSMGKIKYLKVFSRKKMGNIEYSCDVMDEHYDKPINLSVDGNIIDASRLLIEQNMELEEDIWGRSIFETILKELNASESTLDSVAQILYDYVFKVYKSPDAENMSQEDKLLIGMVANAKFKTDGMAILTDEEELNHETKQVTGINQLLDYLWERLAAAARMPKSVIMGQETGTLTGAQYDLMNYYSRIADMQENDLRPQLEQLVRLLLWAKDEPGGQIDPDSINWHIEFNPLYQVDGATDATIKYNQAQADQIYMQNGVVTAEEVRDSRFGHLGVVNSSKTNADSADWEE